MPTIPRPQCSVMQCKRPTMPGSGFCVDHAPPVYISKAKRTTDREYKTRQWLVMRAGQLSKQPLCQCCLISGRIVSAQHVDHVIPWQSVGPHAFAYNKLQSLCGPCHSVKTGLEQRGVFRHYQSGGVVDYAPGQHALMMQTPDPDPMLGH